MFQWPLWQHKDLGHSGEACTKCKWYADLDCGPVVSHHEWRQNYNLSTLHFLKLFNSETHIVLKDKVLWQIRPLEWSEFMTGKTFWRSYLGIRMWLVPAPLIMLHCPNCCLLNQMLKFDISGDKVGLTIHLAQRHEYVECLRSPDAFACKGRNQVWRSG